MKLLNRIRLGFDRLFDRIKRVISPRAAAINKRRRIYYTRFISRAERKPVSTFVSLLILLLVLIILSNLINRPKQVAQETTLATKDVKVYAIGTSPKVTVQAQIEKSGVIKVVALGAGVVQNIGVEVGQAVGQGANLVSMSTNYQGGNALSVGREIAQVQLGNVLSTLKTNKELIDKQIELANKTDENSDRMREISNQSITDTENLITLNSDILSTLSTQQAELEASNVGGANDTAILQTKQLRAQLQAGNIQLQQGLRNTQFIASSDNPPAQISNISKDIALKQLEIQKKALALNVEVSRLNLALAQINEAIMFPASPINGVVDRVYVKVGQAVTPGTVLVQISGDSKSLVAVALLSRELAQSISRSGVSTLHFEDKVYEEAPFYVSREATDGSLYTAQFLVPQELGSKAADKSYITIDVPVDFPKTGGTIPFVPLDSVFQTQDQDYLFVAKNGKAITRRIKLGQVLGSFVEVRSGLTDKDSVILNRNVIEGDPVRVVK